MQSTYDTACYAATAAPTPHVIMEPESYGWIFPFFSFFISLPPYPPVCRPAARRSTIVQALGPICSHLQESAAPTVRSPPASRPPAVIERGRQRLPGTYTPSRMEQLYSRTTALCRSAAEAASKCGGARACPGRRRTSGGERRCSGRTGEGLAGLS